tara:strand:- start:538 stop:927 length:390 start_codon:yes stop_codon:yes gene_type:complete
MVNFKSPEVNVNISSEQLYTKLSNLNNLRAILPPQITDFESTEDSCSFKMHGMPKINLFIAKKKPFSKISLQAKDSQIPFSLDCTIKENKETCKALLEVNTEINMMMKMMLETPLTNFLNIIAKRLSKI